MKRILSVLLAMTLLLTLLPLSALANTGGESGGGAVPPIVPPDEPEAIPDEDIPECNLPAPETLLWGQYWIDGEWFAEPGYVCFSTVEGAAGYAVTVLQLQGDVWTPVYTTVRKAAEHQYPWSDLYVGYDIQPDYDYYFTVCAMDENDACGAEARSEVWTYTVPREKLEIFNVSWDEENYRMDWTIIYSDMVEYYGYELYRADTEDGEPELVYEGTHDPQYGGPFADELMGEYGPGWYTFRMRAFSKDDTQFADSDWSAFSEPMQFCGATEYLGIPSGLTWHADYHDDVATVRAGSIAFRRAVPDQHAYKVMIFGGSSNYYENEWYYYEGDDSAHFSMNDFIYMDPESGSYRFMVYAMGDGINYLDGDLAASDVWDYTAPETRLPTPTGLNWTEEAGKITLNWTPLDTDCYYEVAFWNVADEESWVEGDSFPNSYGVLGDMDLTATTYQPDDFELEMLGEGKLRFRVRAISRDITVVRNSLWSEVSEMDYDGFSPNDPDDPGANIPGDVTLPAPENLLWGQYWIGGEWFAEPGYVCFSTVEGAVRYDINVWQMNGGTATLVHTPSLLVDDEQGPWTWLSVGRELDAGYDYYFTVCAVDENGAAGAAAQSDIWHYAAPEKQLEVTEPAWSETDFLLTWETNYPELVDRWQYKIFRADTVDGDLTQVFLGNHWPGDGGPDASEIFMEYGTGWYTFRVCARSCDRTQATDSAWSAFSERLLYTVPEKRLEVTDLAWDEENLALTWETNYPELTDRWQYKIFRADTADGEASEVCFTAHWPGEDGPFAGEVFAENGDGWYAFQVCPRTNDMTQALDGQWSDLSPWLQYTATAQLPAPTELTWHVKWLESGEYIPQNGVISFTRSEPDYGKYEITILKDGQSIYNQIWSFPEIGERTHISIDELVYLDISSGEYRFAVRALGDGVQYVHSAWATSEPWLYTEPEAQLATPTDLYWKTTEDGVTLNWTAEEGCRYTVEYWDETVPKNERIANSASGIKGGSWKLKNDQLEAFGEGRLRFRVKAQSPDIVAVRSSEWSTNSKSFYADAVSMAAVRQLEAVTSNNESDVRDAIAAIEDLKQALVTDTGNESTGDLMRKLDATVGETTIEADETFTNFAVEEAQVFGAALNNAGDATLTIGQPKHGETAPELQDSEYRNTLQFSMDITAPDADGDAENGHQLAIPVKLVLPVPQDINPAFLVVLHHKLSDNSWEVVEPYVYQEGGKWFASFVVDSFSDFAFANGMKVTETGENSLLVELTLSDPEAIFLCALYDGDDKMLDVAEISSGDADGILEYGRGTPSYLRLFTLDSLCRPTDNFMIVGLHEE